MRTYIGKSDGPIPKGSTKGSVIIIDRAGNPTEATLSIVSNLLEDVDADKFVVVVESSFMLMLCAAEC